MCRPRENVSCAHRQLCIFYAKLCNENVLWSLYTSVLTVINVILSYATTAQICTFCVELQIRKNTLICHQLQLTVSEKSLTGGRFFIANEMLEALRRHEHQYSKSNYKIKSYDTFPNEYYLLPGSSVRQTKRYLCDSHQHVSTKARIHLLLCAFSRPDFCLQLRAVMVFCCCIQTLQPALDAVELTSSFGATKQHRRSVTSYWNE
jgi:hypothetical protein